MTAPKAPEPEARFRVASAADAELVEPLAGQSDLAFALAAWKPGMRQEAREAVARLAEQTPGSVPVQRLAAAMAALAARRQP